MTHVIFHCYVTTIYIFVPSGLYRECFPSHQSVACIRNHTDEPGWKTACLSDYHFLLSGEITIPKEDLLLLLFTKKYCLCLHDEWVRYTEWSYLSVRLLSITYSNNTREGEVREMKLSVGKRKRRYFSICLNVYLSVSQYPNQYLNVYVSYQ